MDCRGILIQATWAKVQGEVFPGPCEVKCIDKVQGQNPELVSRGN